MLKNPLENPTHQKETEFRPYSGEIVARGRRGIADMIYTNQLVAEQLSLMSGKPIDQITMQEALPLLRQLADSPQH
ncbi:hypothetical protein KKE34_01980 [Patescibacteria group bacterium]|nr:hypothetical protein [Patescibacteria group bacterium]MBU1885354.1 hypothetical protein [Patescibacteria group bacterium]